MGFFRNVTVFEYTEEGAEVRPVDLEFAAAVLRARPPEKHEGSTIGFVPALWSGALEMVHVSGAYAMAAVRIEQKRVPPSLWREDTSRRCGEFAAREGREPSREECAALKAASWADLLGRAFPRARVVRVLFAPGLVAVGTASKNDVDEVCGLIRQALGSLPIRPVREPSVTRTVLTHWVKNGAPADRKTGVGFHLGEAALLKGRPMKGEGPAEVVTLRNAHLPAAEVRSHLEHRKDVERLAFQWRMSDEVSVRGTVDHEFVLRSLKDEGLVADTGSAEDAASIYAAEFLVEADTLVRLIAALRAELLPGAKAPAGNGVATERHVRIAADLYKARDTARRMCGEKYSANMAEIGGVLKEIARARGVDVLVAATDAAKDGRTGFDAWMILAAAVELIEPTPVEG